MCPHSLVRCASRLASSYALAWVGVIAWSPTAEAQVGPDSFGYSAIRSTDPGGPGFNFIDIRGKGLLVATGDDRNSLNSGINAPVPLGKPFPLYGTIHPELVPSTNGFLSTSLTDQISDPSNDCPLPAPLNGGAGKRIYVLHDDLVGDVFYQYFAVCPRPHDSGQALGASVFLWSVVHFGPANPAFLFEAVLYDNGDIVFLYGPGNAERGSGSTTGLQDEPPTTGLTIACNTADSIPDNSAIRITQGLHDGLLQVSKASFGINWASHAQAVAADTFALDATVQRSGLLPDLNRTTVRVRFNGLVLVFRDLDAKGNGSSSVGASPSFKLKLDAKSGRLTLKMRGLDLREALDLINADEEGTKGFTVDVWIRGAGLETEYSIGCFEMAFATKQDKLTKGSFSSKKNASIFGLFRALDFDVEEEIGEHSFELSRSVLLGNAEQPLLIVDRAGVSGDLRLTLGSAPPIEIPFSTLAVTGSGATAVFDYEPGLGTVPNLVAFKLDNAAKTLSFSVASLGGTGVPLAGLGEPTQHLLPIVLDCETAIGVLRLRTSLDLRRKTETTTKWSF